MLGNFSFGQYFKEGAIDFAWEFVFDHMKVDPDKFSVTVFAGDPELGLGEDEEAVRLWEAKGLPRSASSGSIARTTSGRSAARAPAGRTPSSSTTAARRSAAAARPARRAASASASSSSGTSSSWSTSCTRTARSRRFRSRTSTPAWASSAAATILQGVIADLRHRRLPGDHGLDRRRRAASRTATPRPRPRRTGSSPTTAAG